MFRIAVIIATLLRLLAIPGSSQAAIHAPTFGNPTGCYLVLFTDVDSDQKVYMHMCYAIKNPGVDRIWQFVNDGSDNLSFTHSDVWLAFPLNV